MSNTINILDAMIMVECLSEGDISTSDKTVLTFDDMENNDYYSFIKSKISEARFQSYQKGGVVVYFDVFDFTEILDFLKEKYGYEKTDEDIRTGKKFSFALYFDKEMTFCSDKSFFVQSAYIRYNRELSQFKKVKEFEEEFKEQLSQDFDNTSLNKERFNIAFLKQLNKFNISITDCRVQILKNIETDAANMHSFFIDDLEKAKTINTSNLKAYLFGKNSDRINLDSKSDSPNFNSEVFEEILQPQNYPLGRFPSNTKFALSLMQQVAVNLAIGYDHNTIRSVNGPPGTGKTTLLKDIFAELVVKQSYDIASMSAGERQIKGTPDTCYYKNASIGVIPDYLAENSIVVASSNNGAAQNIVNELPLIKDIDEELKEELCKADYFMGLSNSDLSIKWVDNEQKPGKKCKELVCEPKSQKTNWGLFSLEGGKADNVKKIITSLEHINNYLKNEYNTDPGAYSDFINLYNTVQHTRKTIQKKSLVFSNLNDLSAQAVKIETAINDENTKWTNGLGEYESVANQNNAKKAALNQQIADAENEIKQNKESENSLKELQQTIKKSKPHFWAKKADKMLYKERLKENENRLENVIYEAIDLQNHLKALKQQINSLDADIQSHKYRKIHHDKIIEEYTGMLLKINNEIASIRENCKDISPLDMGLEYDKLQLSNPWFDKEYRVAQSKLFISALRVRKQFLYENRSNINAAIIIWNRQKECLDKKHIISAAWGWINMAIPVISSTFASFGNMCRNLGTNSIGHLFIDEAGQALPQAAVGAVFRSRHIMVVGDPLQIKPVLTLDSNFLSILRKKYDVTEKYLSDSASVQTLCDAASQYGFYREKDKSDESWIGIPLWVHRRCQYPMFSISNEISYNGLMVQGNPGYGKAQWYDIGGSAENKYVSNQADFLIEKIKEIIEQNELIEDEKMKKTVYVISPFSNVAFKLSQKLKEINFTRFSKSGKPDNVGTVHTFQGKEAKVVFFVLGADSKSSGAASWAVGEANIMNVAATRAKEEFYIIGDKNLYLNLGSDVSNTTYRIINEYNQEHSV